MRYERLGKHVFGTTSGERRPADLKEKVHGPADERPVQQRRSSFLTAGSIPSLRVCKGMHYISSGSRCFAAVSSLLFGILIEATSGVDESDLAKSNEAPAFGRRAQSANCVRSIRPGSSRCKLPICIGHIGRGMLDQRSVFAPRRAGQDVVKRPWATHSFFASCRAIAMSMVGGVCARRVGAAC